MYKIDGLLLLCSYSMFIVTASSTVDTINTSQSLRDGETLVSAGGRFELGFFSPGSSKNRYLGMWHKLPVKSVFWIANREAPLADMSGFLKITNQGTLLLLNQNGSIIWSSNSSTTAKNPTAQLLDTGNFVVKDETGNFRWQSHDYPCDTLLPGMKLGRNTKTGLDWSLSTWKSLNDPSPGRLNIKLELSGYPEFFVWKDSEKKFRLGPWNGLRFSGVPQLSPNPIYTYDYIHSEEIYWIYHVINVSLPWRVVINEDGGVRGHAWIERKQQWVPLQSTLNDDCDNYAQCGAYSSCNVNNAKVCKCLKGFVPNVTKEWDIIGSNGCIRKTPINCYGDGFQKYSALKLPETQNSWFNRTMTLQECEQKCWEKCTCTAFTNLDIRDGGSGCLIWFGDLIDLRQLNEHGQDIYIRMAGSELDHMDNPQANMKKQILLVTVLPSGILAFGLAVRFYIRRKKKKKGNFGNISANLCQLLQDDVELPLFDLTTIIYATDNFSDANKLGQGGFGPVYKGRLRDGHVIAVKRLSKNSAQGLDEFKNEVMFIAKLQHRNLVKLLGCCIEADEMMLIYEFLPNKSLDIFIFDKTLSKQLTWPIRYKIINGIARGLLYLHQDSRLQIIHRDLKASNVLLDYEMNPKISDFGLAKNFRVNETHGNTRKVVGTYGYMSPEYAIYGRYSTKSDVFSFGVMLIEMVSGKKNTEFGHLEGNQNLLGHAWKLHKEGRSIELVDATMRASCNTFEVLRLIQISLLCVQQSPKDRPSMSSVVLMLGGEGALPLPKQPGFYVECDIIEENSSLARNHQPSPSNNATITLLEPR